MSRYTPPLEIANTIYEYITCVEVKIIRVLNQMGMRDTVAV